MNNRYTTEGVSSVRLNAGMYALSKLSAAGLAFLVLSLLNLPLPVAGSGGWPVSVAYGLYAYSLAAAIAADGLLKLLRRRERTPSVIAAVYAAAGFCAGLWMAAEQGGDYWLCGLAGLGALLLFRLAQTAGDRLPGLLPVFALFVPLICLLVQH